MSPGDFECLLKTVKPGKMVVPADFQCFTVFNNLKITQYVVGIVVNKYVKGQEN